MKISAIIPVRKGSQRVINKNIKPLLGTSLLEIKLKQLLRVPELDEVIVNSDCMESKRIAESLGVTFHHRDPYFCSDSVPMSDVYAAIVENIKNDVVLYATVTTPFIDAPRYSDAIRQYAELGRSYDSIHSAQRVRDFLIKDGNPLNYDPRKFPRSQDLPNICKLVFGFSVLPREIMYNKKSSVGYNPLFLEMNQLESIDIDTELDFKICEALMKESL